MKKGRVDWQQIPVWDPVTGKLRKAQLFRQL
jgi:hypothetical protein